MIKVDLKHIYNCVTPEELSKIEPRLAAAHKSLAEHSGPGHEYTGWLYLPRNYDRAELKAVKEAAKSIRQDSEVLLVLGVGGSYLGAHAAIDYLCPPSLKKGVDILFAGNNFSAAYLNEIIAQIGNRDFSINVISKSGATLETALSFRVFKKLLEDKYGDENARRRIYVTTDKDSGLLNDLANIMGYSRFTVPSNIGGRYSVLSSVGLLPMAAAGIDIDAVLNGAYDAMAAMSKVGPDNPAWQYAAARSALYSKGKKIELLTFFEPSFRLMSEWWKQLFGESEGKDRKGIFPASALFSTDLHSLGQYLQDGERILFETMLCFEYPNNTNIPYSADDTDKLNYLTDKSFEQIQSYVAQGCMLAHSDGGTPNLCITSRFRYEYALGELFYFFQLSCALSGYLLGVNPFDQPGVEHYKKNISALLGHPDFVRYQSSIKKRLSE